MFLKKLYIERDVVENFEKDNSYNEKSDIDGDVEKQSKTLDDVVLTQTTRTKSVGHDLDSRSKKRKPDEIEIRLLKALEDDDKPNRHLSFFHGVMHWKSLTKTKF